MMPLVRRVLASLLLTLSLPLGLAARQQGAAVRPAGEMVVRAYTFKYQRASDAVALVHPLLSARGTVELQPGGNTLVIRDVRPKVDVILPVLHRFDHPARSLRIEMMIVRASRAAFSPPVVRSDLPEELTRRLRKLLSYDSYELEAQAQVSLSEGERVTYELGDAFRVSFEVGTVLADRRVKLSDFKIARKAARKGSVPQQLIHTHLNLRLDQIMSLGLARSEESRDALMVVVTVKEEARP